MFNVNVSLLRKILIPVALIGMGLTILHYGMLFYEIIETTIESYKTYRTYSYYRFDASYPAFPIDDILRALLSISSLTLVTCSLIGFVTQGLLIQGKGDEAQFKNNFLFPCLKVLLIIVFIILGFVGLYFMGNLAYFAYEEMDAILELEIERIRFEDPFELFAGFPQPLFWAEGHLATSVPLNFLSLLFSFILLPYANIALFIARFKRPANATPTAVKYSAKAVADEPLAEKVVEQEKILEEPKVEVVTKEAIVPPTPVLEMEATPEEAIDLKEEPLPASSEMPLANNAPQSQPKISLPSMAAKKQLKLKPVNRVVRTPATSTSTSTSLIKAPTSASTPRVALASLEGRGFFSFTGRSTRGEYWGVAFLVFILSFIGGMICFGIMMFSLLHGVLLCGMLFIGLIVFSLPVTVRRYHDLNMSGLWFLLFIGLGLIPCIGAIAGIVNFILLGCVDGTPGPNTYGPCPKGRGRVINTNVKMSPQMIELRLQRLENLYTKKLITKAKYELQKKALLAKLKDIQTTLANETSRRNQENAELQAQCDAIREKINHTKTPTTTPPKSAEDRLVELKTLYDKGLISEDEYQSQRKQILTQV